MKNFHFPFQYTMHIVEISPEEAVVEESEYTESMTSEHSLCQHCGADYCDDDTCPCGTKDGTGNAQTDDSGHHNVNEGRAEGPMEEGSDAEKTLEEESSAADDGNGGALLTNEEYDRSGDVAEWVNSVNPDYDVDGAREESAASGPAEEKNANNNNRCNHDNSQWQSGGKCQRSAYGIIGCSRILNWLQKSYK